MDPYASQTPPPPPAEPGMPAGWAAPEQPKGGSKLLKILIPIIAVIVIGGGGLLALSYFNAHKDAGKVLFSTDKPVAGESTGKCSPDHQVTSIKAGTSVYATYFFSSTQGDSPVSMAITKDGSEFLPATALPLTDTKGLDCFSDTSDLSQLLGTGTYKFTFTSDGKTVAEGTLTVTP